jgi:dynein heavy chain, axonemal
LSSQAQNLKLELQDAEKQAKVICQRQKIFKEDMADFATIRQMMKDLEPFLVFWTSIADWRNWESSYLSDDFISLKVDEIEHNVTSLWRTMYKLGKTFSEDEEGMRKNAGTIRNEVSFFLQSMTIFI